MKLAIFDQIGNHGGGSRVVRALLPELKACRSDVELTYFGNPSSIRREKVNSEFSRAGIAVRELASLKFSTTDFCGIKGTSAIVKRAQEAFKGRMEWLPEVVSGAVENEIERVAKGFDLAFFPWPFLMRCPSLDCPMVGIFHDFNYKYFFGSAIFDAKQQRLLDAEMPAWLDQTLPVVSTNFMANEIATFYPEYSHKVQVIHLAPMSTVSSLSEQEARSMVFDLGIDCPYILYPTNLSVHKNLGSLLAALSLLSDHGYQIKLVLTGAGTEFVNGQAGWFGMRRVLSEANVIGLGYVSNDTMDALIRSATVVVSTSLYEAGNGPGLDAWVHGVPVAMSNIPPFLEHLDEQGVEADIFDPRNPYDIASKLEGILGNYEQARERAKLSKHALQRLTWTSVAKKYWSVFDKAMEEYRHV